MSGPSLGGILSEWTKRELIRRNLDPVLVNRYDVGVAGLEPASSSL